MSGGPAFFDRWVKAWTAPDAGRIVGVLRDDVVLQPPMVAPIGGRAAGQAGCAAPGFDIERRAGSAGLAFIEFQRVMRSRRGDRCAAPIDCVPRRGTRACARRANFNSATMFARLAVRGSVKYQLAGSRSQ